MKAQIRYLRAVPRRRAPLVPFYAGARIAETVALDIDDVRLSARKGILRIYGKGQRVREIPIYPELRKAVTDWLEERCDWPGAKDNPALFVNQRGHRLSAKGAHDVITGIASRGGLDDHVTARGPLRRPRTARPDGARQLTKSDTLHPHRHEHPPRPRTRQPARPGSVTTDC